MDKIIPCPDCGKRNRVPSAANGVPRCAACHTPLPWLTAASDGDHEEVVTQPAARAGCWPAWSSSEPSEG